MKDNDLTLSDVGNTELLSLDQHNKGTDLSNAVMDQENYNK